MQGLRTKILQAYGSNGLKILDHYNPDTLAEKQMDSEACFFGDHPTLAQLKAKFGTGYPTAWLMAHLHDLSEFCGCREKLSGHALQQCASTISMEFYWLKVTELMLFFHQFKSGKYGRFYGSVDPLVITTSLREFLNDRGVAYEKHYREEEERKASMQPKRGVSWEEYCRRNGIKGRKTIFDGLTPTPKKQANKGLKESVEDIIRIAKSLLTETNKNVVEEFGRIFKKKYGSTPAEYIKNHQKDAAKVTKS